MCYENKKISFYHLKEEEKDGSTLKKLEFIYDIELEEEKIDNIIFIISEKNKYAAYLVPIYNIDAHAGSCTFYIYDIKNKDDKAYKCALDFCNILDFKFSLDERYFL